MASAFNRTTITGLVGGTIRTNRRSLRFEISFDNDALPVYARRLGEETAPPRGTLVLIDADLRTRPTPYLTAHRVVVLADATADSLRRAHVADRSSPGFHHVTGHDRRLRDGRVISVSGHDRGQGPLHSKK